MAIHEIRVASKGEDPKGKVTLSKGDTLVYSSEGYKASIRQK